MNLGVKYYKLPLKLRVDLRRMTSVGLSLLSSTLMMQELLIKIILLNCEDRLIGGVVVFFMMF